MSTQADRREVRERLIDQGFTRASATMDSGDGAYSEEFRRPSDTGTDIVTISWAPKSPYTKGLTTSLQQVRYDALVDKGIDHAAALRDARKW